MNSSTKEKFDAAVKLIQSMPKNGSFQPSTQLQLRFYSLFKQANEGPCKGSKPSIFNIVARTKWDAWNSLGNMPAEEAMKQYIDELKKIVETMSFTEDVADFLDTLGPFYEIVYDNGSPVRLKKLEEALASVKRSDESGFDTGYSTEEKRTPSPILEPEVDDSHEVVTQPITEKQFSRSASVSDDYKSIYSSTVSMYGSVISNGSKDDRSDDEFVDPETDFDQVRYSHQEEHSHRECSCGDNLRTVEDELKGTLQQLRMGLEELKMRVATLEAAKIQQSQKLRVKNKPTSWWPFADISPSTAAFVIAWPVMTHFLLSWLLKRR